jgi:hypothetical protein
MMEGEDEECEQLLLRVIEALPRLKQYRLSLAQKAFTQKFEELIEQEKNRSSLVSNQVVQ